MRGFITGAVFCLFLGSACLAHGNKSERIALRFLSPSEAQLVFVPVPIKAGGGGLGNEGERGALPAGIVALGVDPKGSALLATGSAQGLADLRKIIRLADIPPRSVRLTITALTPDAKLREDLRVELTEAKGTISDDRALTMSVFEKVPANLIAEARKRDGIRLETGLTTASHRSAYFFIPASGGKERRFTVQPRVNGDNSVTLFFGEVNVESFHIRRVASGAQVMVMPDESLALLISVDASTKKRR